MDWGALAIGVVTGVAWVGATAWFTAETIAPDALALSAATGGRADIFTMEETAPDEPLLETTLLLFITW